MVTYDDIKTALDAGWNVAIITEPGYANLHNNADTIKINTVYIGVDEMGYRHPAGFTGNFNKKRTLFSIKIAAANRTNLDKITGEIIRILETKAVNGGYWRIYNEPFYKEYNKFVTKLLNGEEIMYGSG